MEYERITAIEEFGDAGRDREGNIIQPKYRITMTTGEGTEHVADFVVEEFYYPEEWDNVVKGSVKWDGCMNWSTDQSCAVHFCRPETAAEFAEIFKMVWKLAAKCMPKTWDH